MRLHHPGSGPRARLLPRGGFTLIELMVAGMVAAVVMAAVYLTYTQSVHGYRVQSDVLDTYGRLRFGLDHIKTDLRRAGVSATLNSNIDPFVRPPLPSQSLLGFAVMPSFDTGAGSAEKATNVFVEPTAILLFGDYFTSVVFPEAAGTLPSSVAFPVQQVDGTVLQLDPSTITIGEQEFKAAFLPASNPDARLLHVEHRTEGTHYYFPIVDADFANLTITIGVPAPTALTSGIYKSIYVNPVGFVRYRIAADTRELAPGPDGTLKVPEAKTDLVREEVAWNDLTGDAIPGTRLVLVENAVDLQLYDFVVDQAAPGQPPALAVFPDIHSVVDAAGVGMLGQGVTAQPQDLRFVTIKLSVRSADEDPDVPFMPRESLFAPLRRYDVDPDIEGSARVESLALRVQLFNATMRDM